MATLLKEEVPEQVKSPEAETAKGKEGQEEAAEGVRL